MKSLSSLIKHTLAYTKIIDISNERAYITIYSTDIQKKIKDCYEQLYAHKFDELDVIDKFLENITYWNINWKRNLISPVSSIEIEFIVRTFSTGKSSVMNSFIHIGRKNTDFIQTQIIGETEEGRIPNLFFWGQRKASHLNSIRMLKENCGQLSLVKADVQILT